MIYTLRFLIGLWSLLLTPLFVSAQVFEINTVRDVTVQGYDSASPSSNLESGFAVEVGDVNADGQGDLVVGTHHGSPNGVEAAGEAFVLFGPLPNATYDLANSGAYQIRFTNDLPGERMGSALALGDVNGDGIVDVVLAAPPATLPGRMASGKVYVFFGPHTAGTYTRAANADIQINGTITDDRLGLDSAVGDIDLDGVPDLVIASRRADPNGKAEAGKVYIVYGPIGAGTYEIAALADRIYNGIDAGDGAGSGLSIGDVTGDGLPDLVIAAAAADPPGRTDAGEVYLVPGPLAHPPVPLTLELSLSATATFYGIASSDFTQRVETGDLNQDGAADLIMGATFADVMSPTRVNAGRAYVLYGPYPFPGVYEIIVELDRGYKGIAAGDNAGSSVAVGQLRGSAAPDLVIGASQADPLGRIQAGETYVIEGP